MVPYHRPIPERKPRDKNAPAAGGMMNAWIQAEKMMQIALMLPCAGFIGWLAGYCLDRWLHQAWIGMAGAVFGIVAGLVAAVRMATMYANDPATDKRNESGSGSKTGDSNKPS